MSYRQCRLVRATWARHVRQTTHDIDPLIFKLFRIARKLRSEAIGVRDASFDGSSGASVPYSFCNSRGSGSYAVGRGIAVRSSPVAFGTLGDRPPRIGVTAADRPCKLG